MNLLSIAREYLPELKNKIQVLDIEKETPSTAQITICSATFEHLDDPDKSLSNIFDSTTEHIILRTMIGSNDKRFIQSDSRFVNQPYNINQYGLFEMSKKFFERGFNFTCIPDHATNMSKKYEVSKGSGVMRQMYVILGSRNKTRYFFKKDPVYLKKLKLMGQKCYQINTINKNVLNTTLLLQSEFI